MEGKRVRYTKEQKDRIIDYVKKDYNLNKSVGQLADELEVGYNVVYSLMRKCGLQSRYAKQLTPNDKEYIYKMYGKMKTADIAEYLGVTDSAVSYHVKKMGVWRRRVYRKKELEDYIKEYYNRKTVNEMANEMEVSSQTIRNYLKELGLTGVSAYQIRKTRESRG